MVTAERDTPGAERSDDHRDGTPGSAQFQQAGGAQGQALAADGNPHHAELNGAPAPAGRAARARWTRRSRAATPHATAVIKLPAREISDRAQSWLRNAMIALGILAAAAAVVSWDAQYVLVRTVKHSTPVAALEAGIPDVGALIFAALGIALALHGRHAIRARALNVIRMVWAVLLASPRSSASCAAHCGPAPGVAFRISSLVPADITGRYPWDEEGR